MPLLQLQVADVVLEIRELFLDLVPVEFVLYDLFVVLLLQLLVVLVKCGQLVFYRVCCDDGLSQICWLFLRGMRLIFKGLFVVVWQGLDRTFRCADFALFLIVYIFGFFSFASAAGRLFGW